MRAASRFHALFASPRLFALAALATALVGSAHAQETGFFGPSEAFELQPEVDVFYHANEQLRLLLQVRSTLIPSQGNASVLVGGFADWFIAPLVQRLVSPDLAKTHALNIRFGGSYTGGSSRIAALQLDLTPRYFLPWGIHVFNRNRLQTRWNLAMNDSFSFRYRPRFQLEREFEVGKVGLTPLANVEWIWQSPPAMWEQFRMQAGLQCSFGGLGRGQLVELNYSTVTYLQPRRHWRPVVGVIWEVFF